MADTDLPREVRELIIRQLHSMEEIELLLVLESEAGGLTLAEIRHRLRLPPSNQPLPSIARLKDLRLISCKEVAGESRYSYAVTDSTTRRAVELLRVAYNERPVTLVRLVYNRPTAAQTFADAFRITKDPEP